MAGLRLNLLGKPRVIRDDAPVTGFTTAKTEALLYYLAATGHPHSRDALASLLWSDMPDAQAKRNLTKALSTLRRLIDPYLVFERQDVAFNRDVPHQLDVHLFEMAVTKASEHAGDLASLREAMALYRGDFLDGFFVKDAAPFEEWALAERERLRELMLGKLDELIAHHAARTEYAIAKDYARRLLELDPWRESAHRQMMTLLARQGQYSAALAQYEKCRRTLAEELGVEPMAETTALHERIQAMRAFTPHPLPAEAEPFVGRETELARIQRMLTDPHCRLVTVVGLGGAGKTRLALAAARQINREDAIHFVNGAVFIPLTDVSNASELPVALVNALRVPLASDVHPMTALLNFLRNKELLLVLDNFEHLLPSGDEVVALVTQIVRESQHVKVLITSREPLHLAAEWRLTLEGLAYPSDVSSGSPESVADHFESVQLFVQATQQVRPDYALTDADAPHVYRLCRLVAGMPLAIKLAAAWMRAMDAERIVAEVQRNLDLLAVHMRDLPPRQRSVRASFDYTWNYLTADDRSTVLRASPSTSLRDVLAALSIFRGGFRPDAAEHVAGATLPTLATLVEKSLVQTTPEGRYGMHELLRQFAAEKLAQSPAAETAARHRHSQFYLHFLKSRESGLVGREQRAAVAAVAEEIDNVVAAWRWAVVHNDLDAIEPAIDALYTFYQVRSRFQEGEALFTWTIDQWQDNGAAKEHPHNALVLAKLLARCGALSNELHKFEAAHDRLHAALALTDDSRERAFALRALGLMAVTRDERAIAEERLQASLAICRDIGDLNGVVVALIGLASAASQLGDFGPARELAREAVAISRQLERPDLIAHALGTLAWSSNCLGAYRESQACREESLALYREIGDPMGEAIAINFLGWDAWCQGGAELATAISRHEEALITYRALGNRAMLAMCLGDLALATIEQGDSERALQYAREGLTIARDVDLVHFIGYTLALVGLAASEQGDSSTGRAHLLEALRTFLELQKADGCMNVFFFFAKLLLKESGAADDATLKSQKRAQAMELLSTVVRHRATWQPIKDRTKRLITELASELPGGAAHEPIPDWQMLAKRLISDSEAPPPLKATESLQTSFDRYANGSSCWPR